ncbi:MAG: NUDIX hydrolase [Chloroflexota bacterium]
MNRPKLTPWKTLSKKTLLDFGKFLKVESHQVELPNGTIIPDWSFLIGPNAAIVLAETVDKEYLCFHQVRYAIEGETLAAIGGHVEEGEDPLVAAKRELLEETGYEAAEWISLGQLRFDPSRGLGTSNLFFARGVRKVAGVNSDDLEEQHLLKLSRKELEQASRNGEFKVASWAALVAMSLNILYVEDKLVS